MPGHPLADARSLDLHRAVAERLREDPRVLARARVRVAGWQAAGRPYADAWAGMLAGSPDEVADRIVSTEPEAADLRQCSPFAGALSPRERWRIWRSVSPEATT